MKKKHPDCECHKEINGRLTCLATCMKCSEAKKTIITQTKDYKKIEIIFS